MANKEFRMKKGRSWARAATRDRTTSGVRDGIAAKTTESKAGPQGWNSFDIRRSLLDILLFGFSE
jgi:hypothetical protein